MSDEYKHMWKYLRDKYGYEEALEQYYPEMLKSNTILMAAYIQLKASKCFIDNIMKEDGDD